MQPTTCSSWSRSLIGGSEIAVQNRDPQSADVLDSERLNKDKVELGKRIATFQFELEWKKSWGDGAQVPEIFFLSRALNIW